VTGRFYFEEDAPGIDWEGRGTLVVANPEWIARDPATARAAIAALPPLPAHIWVATSGSSIDAPGRLRWVALSTEAFLASARAVNAHLSSTAADTWAHALPVFHVGGLGILARAYLSGGRVRAAVAGRWDAETFCARVRDAGATLSALVPSQVHDLVSARLAAPPSLRAVVIGGAAFDPDLHRAARALGWPCLPSYGLTETCSQVATAALTSLERPDRPTILPVLGHASIRADVAGSLSVRAASLLTCVADWDGASARVSDPKRDGWLETEDVGRVDLAGVEVFGRATESVKVLGELVSLPRVEARIRRWVDAARPAGGAPADLAIVALPHARRGHELVLVLGGGDPAEAVRLAPALAAFCAEALLPYERIGRIAWTERIPRTPLGKCQRALLAHQMGFETGPDR
jgi:O-succinylbenzoic acid--CoA ligase